MIVRTKGIVLSHIPYKESSIICKIYTEELGIKSFIVHNVRSKKNSNNTIFLQPLTLVDLDIYHKAKATLHRIKEHRITIPFHSIPFNQNKRAVTFFVTEALEKCLKEEHANSDMFAFLSQAIELFDSQGHYSENFHIFLLFFLTKYLGFFPHSVENEGDDRYFDLREGKYCLIPPFHQNFLDQEDTKIWKEISEKGDKLLTNYKIDRLHRKIVLDKLLEYYALHIPAFGEFKTLNILQQLFD